MLLAQACPVDSPVPLGTKGKRIIDNSWLLTPLKGEYTKGEGMPHNHSPLPFHLCHPLFCLVKQGKKFFFAFCL